MNKLKLFSLFAAMLFAASMWAANPIGSIDAVSGKHGSITVNGWAIDPDNGGATVEVHVYLFSSETETDLAKAVKGINGTYANLDRPDLKGDWGSSVGELYGTLHGFDRTIDLYNLGVGKGTYYVRIYALNVAGSGNNVELTYSSDGTSVVKSVSVSDPYTVKYNANGGNGAPADQKKVQGINLTLSSTTPTRTGYTFNNWNTKQDGSGNSYAKGATYTTDFWSPTLYAQWTIVNYTIGYTLNGGSVSGNPTSYNVETATITLKNPTRTGYTFKGWTGSNGTTPQTSVQIAKGSTGNKTYTANWTANKYTVTFDKQNGTGGSNNVSATYDAAMPSATMPTRTGYTFNGYFDAASGGTKYYNANGSSARTWNKTSNATLYAQWTVNKYTVTFDKQNGTGGSNNVSATYDAAMPSATMPTRASYTFEGYFDATTGGTKYYNADGTSAKNWNKAANTTLYARWTPITYNISYELNGGEVATANPATYTIETATIALNNPTRAEWVFNGWTGSNGDTRQTSVSIAKGSTGDKSYNAHWYLACLDELYTALGTEVWTGYGSATGVISYSRGDEPQEFRAVFMGGTFTVDIHFEDFISGEKKNNSDGSVTYSLVANVPPVTGMKTETLHITLKDGKVVGMDSQNAGVEMSKEQEISGWAALQEALNAGGVIKLSADVTAAGTDAALTLPADKTAILELNGHTINRALKAPAADGSVIINNGVLAIMGAGQIKGGNTTGNGGGILNNGTLTLYGGEITGNKAKGNGGGVYNTAENTATEGFWMTGGLIHNNTGLDYPAIGGEVSFNSLTVVQIDELGKQVSAKTAKAGMKKNDYIQPVMMDPAKFALLSELHSALGTEVWTGYGTATGVISYSRGDAPNEFKAVFMGGTYTVDLPFGDVASINKTDNGDGSFTYTMVANVPPVTGMETETVQVTIKDGKITALASQNAGMEMSPENDAPLTDWASLKAAMANGGVIKLAQDFVAGATDEALIVPESKTVVLELNGHTLNRALTAPVANGSVIINNGTLAIMGNENSKIMGGNTTGNGGGILNNGTLTLYGGEITGNSASAGAGVYNKKVNTETEGFWMTGGLIDNNVSGSYPAIGGDVYFNALAVIQINAEGKTASPAMVMQGLYESYSYIKPVMPSMEDMSKPTITVNYLGFDGAGFDHEVVELNQHEAPAIEGFTFLRWEFKDGLLSVGIKLQAVYKSNNENTPAQVTVGEYTLVRPSNENEYILQ